MTLFLIRLNRKNSDLSDVYRLYVFIRSLPNLLSKLDDLISCSSPTEEQNCDGEEKIITIKKRYYEPLEILIDKFQMYLQFVEHALDLSQLPELLINAKHDPQLYELSEDIDVCHKDAEKILLQARNNWASFADVKLEEDTQHGLILRTTKGDDERQLRANNSHVCILSIQKVRSMLHQTFNKYY